MLDGPGAVSILPTLLYLTTGVLKECSTKSASDSTVLSASPVLKAVLHCLMVLCTDKYCRDERSSNQWKSLLQSALAKIIDLTKTGWCNKIMIV